MVCVEETQPFTSLNTKTQKTYTKTTCNYNALTQLGRI